jgi:hypothetical protein
VVKLDKANQLNGTGLKQQVHPNNSLQINTQVTFEVRAVVKTTMLFLLVATLENFVSE